MKRPSFQFYPADWLRDTALRTCSVAARGLWMDMICFMHEGTPYGHLKVNRKVILPCNLAVMVGANLEEIGRLLEELEEAGVFARDEEGCIYSKRMVRDENLRNIRAEGGKKGGNPALLRGKVKGKVNLMDNHKVVIEDKQKSTPSSSSSSSSSKNNKCKATLEELKAFSKEIGMPESDGESMFYHWESNGWKNGSTPVKDWQAGIRKWKSQGWLPSQKQKQTAFATPKEKQWNHSGMVEHLEIPIYDLGNA